MLQQQQSITDNSVFVMFIFDSGNFLFHISFSFLLLSPKEADAQMQKRGLPMQHSKSKVVGNLNARM